MAKMDVLHTHYDPERSTTTFYYVCGCQTTNHHFRAPDGSTLLTAGKERHDVTPERDTNPWVVHVSVEIEDQQTGQRIIHEEDVLVAKTLLSEASHLTDLRQNALGERFGRIAALAYRRMVDEVHPTKD